MAHNGVRAFVSYFPVNSFWKRTNDLRSAALFSGRIESDRNNELLLIAPSRTYSGCGESTPNALFRM